MRDHGGNIDAAIARFGGPSADWIDLSTGINRVAYPLPPIPAPAWTMLPTRAATERLIAAARGAYRTEAAILPVAGAQAAIQMIRGSRCPASPVCWVRPTTNTPGRCAPQAGAWRR